MPELPQDSGLRPIAAHVAGKSPDQVRALRDGIISEIALLEASVARRQRDFPMHAQDFDILRDQRRCAERRREVDYLERLLEAPPT